MLYHYAVVVCKHFIYLNPRTFPVAFKLNLAFFQLDINLEKSAKKSNVKILINLVIRVYRGKLSKLSRELISLIDRARV